MRAGAMEVLPCGAKVRPWCSVKSARAVMLRVSSGSRSTMRGQVKGPLNSPPACCANSSRVREPSGHHTPLVRQSTCSCGMVNRSLTWSAPPFAPVVRPGHHRPGADPVCVGGDPPTCVGGRLSSLRLCLLLRCGLLLGALELGDGVLADVGEVGDET